MGKAKIPIIVAACILLISFLAGILIFHKNSPDIDIPLHKDLGKVAASTVSPAAITKPIDSSVNYTYIPPTIEYDDNNEDNEEDHMPNIEPTTTPWTPASEMDLDPKSITVYINKEYYLPKDYVPENLVVPNITFDITGNSERKFMRVEAAVAIERMFSAALEDGFTLYGISGYRSYKRQKEIFLNNIVHKGKKHTLKYSAAPGTSEHQTGLAMDVSSKSVRFKLVSSFATCDEGKWLEKNAHKFGFIIRYPKNQYNLTGYAYEPWHIRYVGEDLANYLYVKNMTLDEYYKYEPSEDFDYEEKYADLINYKPPVTPTPIPEEELEENPDGLTDEDLENDELEDEDLEDDELEDEDLEDDELEDDELEDEGLEDDELEDDELEDDELEDDELEDEDPEREAPENDDLEGGESEDGKLDEEDKNDDAGNTSSKDLDSSKQDPNIDVTTDKEDIISNDFEDQNKGAQPPVNPDTDIRN